ncbi:hypothetical protein [Rhabdothermincola sediminis]|uniref:hypothetical protein n=1 Tax=Rhabdothermincola sediminis TaxID=2751370 RepID=UPI001AA03DE0|nr:hypothetical protein [Rhabdothermincola sediminis]
MTSPAFADALRELRRTRRRNRLAEVHWVDALYRVYIAALAAVIFVLFAAGRLPDDRLSNDEALTFLHDSVPVLGLIFAVAAGIGARSGGRGGPLVLEGPVVLHELGAPVDRNLALRGPALKQLRFLAFAGVVVGAIVGELAARRLPVNVAAAITACAVTFALLAVLAAGVAMVLSGRRVGWLAANLVAGAIVGWSVLDLLAGTTTSPLTLLARLAFWPIEIAPSALVGVAVAVAVPLAGLANVGGLSIEAAMRRAGLISQLRFAVTLQDVRTVVLLRRQLSQERPRARPWIRLRRGGRLPAAWRRDWQSVARFPAVRLVRLALLGVAAGLAAGAAWRGVTPMIVASGLALYVAGYDAAEPIAQEVDHPTRWESFPMEPGRVLLQHVPAAFVVMTIVYVIGVVSSMVLVPVEVVVRLAPATMVTAAGAAALGAAVGTSQGAPDVAQMAGLGPDMMGFVLLGRLVLPPALVVLGLLPLLAAGSDADALDLPAVQSATTYSLFALLGAFLWLRYRKPKHL